MDKRLKDEVAMDLNIIRNYLLNDTGIAVEPVPVEIQDAPFFVRRQFTFYTINFFGKNLCLLVSNHSGFSCHKFQEIISTAAFFHNKADMIPVFVFASMSKKERLELVKQKIAFMVPDMQMYIPYLGLDFSERIPQVMPPSSSVLRPAAQALVIQQILTGALNGLTINQAAKVMGYTAMGVLRAANQLNELGICKVDYDGYRKVLHFSTNPKELQEKAAVHLRNPVNKTYSVEDDSSLKSLPLAGEFVLSMYSDLAVTRKTYAIQQKDFSCLVKEGKINMAFAEETGCADVQIWSYTLPIWKDKVDRISLALSFKNSKDARVKIAVMNMKEQYKW